MRILEIPFKLTEQFIDTLNHFNTNGDGIELSLLYQSIGKTEKYMRRALMSLIQLGIVEQANNKIHLKEPYASWQNKISTSILKKALTEFPAMKEYLKLLQLDKKQKDVLKIVKASFNLENDLESLSSIFSNNIKYFSTDQPIVKKTLNAVSNVPLENNFFWIDDNGHLMYDEQAHTEKIVQEIEKKRFINPLFIDQARLEDLKELKNPKFDFSKLIKICEEINDAYRIGNYITVGVLVRAIIDHVPPIFSKKNFAEVANSHGTRSFRDIMLNLDNFSRKIADGFLHTNIRKNETLPTATTVDCRNAIDILVGEIISEVKSN